MEQEVKEEKVEKTVSNSEMDETNDNGIPRTLSFDKEDTFNEEEPDKIISDLTNKVVLLEKRYNDLRGKYENLVRNNIQKSSLDIKSTLIGMKWGFASHMLKTKAENDSNKLSELIKEKNDLQEINEKMLNMLTEKEIEIEDFQENFEKYKDEIKSEMEKYLDTIEELEKKNEILEEKVKKQENIDKKLDNVLNEYNSYKKRIDDSILEYIKKEEEMNKEIDEKETKISKMKINIQNLEIEIMKLQNQNEKNEKMANEDKDVFEKILYENEKFTRK